MMSTIYCDLRKKFLIEAMNEIYGNNKNKIIVDKDIENIVPLLDKNMVG